MKWRIGRPWFFGVNALTSALQPWLFDCMLTSPGFSSLLSVSLVWVSDLGSSGLCSAGAVCGRDGCAFGLSGSCSQDGFTLLVACLSISSFFVGLGSACGNSVIFPVLLMM